MTALTKGQRLRITGFKENISQSLKQKIIALGVRKNCEFTICHLAPFKGPVHISMGCVSLGFRLDDFLQIKTELVE